MPEAPEIPSPPSSSFEKRVALSIAILTVILSFVENLGDNAKTDAIIFTNEAANQWAYYQAKSIKEQMAGMHSSILAASAGQSPGADLAKQIEKHRNESQRYEGEKADIRRKAEELTSQSKQQSEINNRCDLSALLLQISVIVCSVAILADLRIFWHLGLAMGAAGAVAGATAFLM